MAGVSPVTVAIELKIGPAFSAAIDVLNLVVAVGQLIPAEHAPEREELLARAEDLAALLKSSLAVQQQ